MTLRVFLLAGDGAHHRALCAKLARHVDVCGLVREGA